MASPNDEPVVYSGAIAGIAVATIPVLRAFNVNISEDQADAIFALLAAIIAAGSIILRTYVIPKQKVPPPLGTMPAPPPAETL